MRKNADFSIEVPGKWVLSGEHSVLRGKRAIAFPHLEVSLVLNYREQKSFSITASPFYSPVKKLIGRACEFLEKDPNLFSFGEIDIQSTIPVAAGLGSSAALSVAMAKLAIWKTGSSLDQWIPLATHLEDVFHGKSSGMDVNVIAKGVPIVFSMERGPEKIPQLEALPHFELFDSSRRSSTKLCIEKVKEWRDAQPECSQEWDDKMGASTESAFSALLSFSKASCKNERIDSELELAHAINSAQDCFEKWGLVSAELLDQKEELLKQGALAVKLTGAGLGGFWVALWPSSTPHA